MRTITSCRLVGDWRDKDLRGARLWECDVTGATLDSRSDPRYPWIFRPKVYLRGALYDIHTRWPAGFDPRRAGAGRGRVR